ncbi:MAG: hypothetical protein IKT40_02650 [Bacilli bacterium]|nr:hypothetical protein [Bacilli bacterium]
MLLNSTENYVLDLENIVNFIFAQNEVNSDSEFVDVYSSDESNNLVLNQRQIREVKNGDTTAKSTIRYDMIKTFIEYLMDADFTDPSFGEAMVLNTMLNEELIKQIEK